LVYCASSRTRELIAQAERDYGIKTIWIHTNPPEEFIIKKLKNYKHTWLFEDGDQAVQNYLDRKPIHQDLDMGNPTQLSHIR